MGIPAFGLGTFRLKGQIVRHSVLAALELGYRAIDTAQIYGNETEIGQAIIDSGVDRNDLFLTTKIWVDNFAGDRLVESLKESLDRLQTDYLDLTLIHWPSPDDAVPLEDYLLALKAAKNQKLTRRIGVSNFTIHLLRQAIAILGAENIATNQIEIYPYFQNRKVAEFTQQNAIQVTSYMTLGVGRILNDSILNAIGFRHGATTAQVALAWAMQLGYSVIPSSTRRAHIQDNLNALSLRLTPEDMAQIAAIDRGERLTNPAGLAPAWDD